MVLRLRKPKKVPTQVIAWLISLALIGAVAGTLLAWFIPADDITEIETSE